MDKKMRFQKRGLRRKLVQLMIFAFIISGGLYYFLHKTVDLKLNNYFDTSDYAEKTESKYAQKFQDYILKNNISTSDTDKITKWVRDQDVVHVSIYKDSVLIYDSYYPDNDSIAENDVEAEYYGWQAYYPMKFADAQTDVFLDGFYDYRIFNYATIAEILLSCLVFMGIVMLGIKRTIDYIGKLEQEVEILEGGQLDCPITRKGNDELSALAHGLDEMRKSFKLRVERDEKLSKANKELVTEMSHDLRTPLTTLLLYTQILKSRKYHGTEQMEDYIEKIDEKANQIKSLSDNMFEFFLILREEEIELMDPQSFQDIFYDIMSEMVLSLQKRGFQVNQNIEFREVKVEVSIDYVCRIMNNIVSNMIKYADTKEEIVISTIYEKEQVFILFANHKLKKIEKVESTGIGIRNIKGMMDKMDGSCEVEETGDLYRIKLQFKTVV